MTLQSNVSVTLRYGAETTFGTQSVAAGQLIRRVSSSLTLTKDAITSNEVRPDQQVQDMRHGSRRVGGSIQGELSYGTYDDFIAAALRSTWSSDKIASGLLTPSFTIEQYYPDLDLSEVFTGCRIADMSVSLPPNGMAAVTFNVQGKDGSILTGMNAPAFASPTAAPVYGVMSGVNGSMKIGGVSYATVTGLDFTVNNNLNSSPVVGANTVPEIFYGRQVVTGNVSIYLDGTTMVNNFINESEITLEVTATTSGNDSLKFAFNRVKLTGMSKTIGPDGGVICSFPFQSLYSASTGGWGAGSIAIQRSDVSPVGS